MGGETSVGYKVVGSADMTDHPMVQAVASPLESMVWDSSVIVVSAAMRIPFKRSSRIRRFPSAVILDEMGAADGDAQEG